MESFSLDESSLISTSSGSKGSQLKYKHDNKWFKVNTTGYEADAEVLTCCILKASNCSNYVQYHKCTVNDRVGCYSENFLKNDEQLITFENLYYVNVGESLTEKIAHLDGVAARIQFVKESVQCYTGLDVSEYVDTIIALDFLIRNGDRHLNNMAIIRTASGYRVAPIFDNGDAFFSSYQKFEPWLTMEECLDRCTAKPFSGSFDAQFSCIGNKLRIDYSAVAKLMCGQEMTRGKEAALFLLEKYRNIFAEDSLQDISVFKTILSPSQIL